MTTLNSGSPASASTWKTIARTMLRTLLNDAGETTYTDTRLDSLLIYSAYYLPMEIYFSTSYTVDITQETVSPEPTDQTDGPDFISFVVLKSACMADQSSFRTAALLQGVKARCGPAILDTNSYGKELNTLLTVGPCETFDILKKEYNFGDNGARIIRAVMSPFASNTFYPPLGGSGNGLLDTNNYHRGR